LTLKGKEEAEEATKPDAEPLRHATINYLGLDELEMVNTRCRREVQRLPTPKNPIPCDAGMAVLACATRNLHGHAEEQMGFRKSGKADF
jgi:hypothetical protein